MIRRLVLILVTLLNLSLASAYADQPVSTTIKGDSQRIALDIPPDLKPGYHSVAVEATDPVTGEITTQNISFCKDLEGTIQWSNSCGAVTALVTQKILESTKERAKLPAFDPISQPKKTLDTQIAAFAALSVLAAGGAIGAMVGFEGGISEIPIEPRDRLYARPEEISPGRRSTRHSEKKLGEEKDLESIESEHLKRYERKEGKGDLLGTWKMPMTEKLDAAFVAGAQRTSRFSPILSRIFYDGNYLRAMFGSVATILHPVGIVLGLLALKSVEAQALPPSWILLLIITSLGVFDALAGFLSAGVFFLGTLLTGHINSRDELLTVVGTIGIFFAPALVASAFRPLRREVKSFADKWERLTDYALAAVLTGWSMTKMVGSLAGLAGIQLPITAFAFKIGVGCALVVAIRLGGEDLATYIYPVRLAQLHPELEHPSKVQATISVIFKTAIFAFLAEPFIGNSIQLWLGIALFVFPKISAITISRKLPKSKVVQKILPKGALKIVVMVFVGTLFGRWVQSQYQDPEEFLKWGFVILGIPGLLLQFASFFADRSSPITWKFVGLGRYFYRFGGAITCFFIVEMALGKNLVDLVLGK